MPNFSRSRTRRVCSLRSSTSSIAILTKTSLVLIRSTTTPKRSRVPKIPARKPCETLLRFDCTFNTTIRSLIVTAVGSRRRGFPTSLMTPFENDPSWKAAPKSGGGSDSASASGSMTVPPPRGFWTFLIRMGIFFRITCSVFFRNVVSLSMMESRGVPAPW
jgi:hypothetical protein